MKRIKLVLLSLLMIQVGLAQSYEYVPFPKSDATWSEWYEYSYPDGYPYKEAYETFSVNGEDTLINGKTYTKLFMDRQTVYKLSEAGGGKEELKEMVYVGGLREENKKIWFLGDTIIHHLKPISINEEILLYDFSLEVGDTVRTSGTIQYDNDNNEDMAIYIQKIDTIQIGGSWRKKFHLAGERLYEDCVWIEGIGSLNGLFFWKRLLDLTGENTTLNKIVGFKSQGELLYMNDEYDSFYPPVANEKIEMPNNKIQIRQMGGSLKFNFNDVRLSHIRIFNIAGVMMENYSVLNQTELVLPIASMKPGIYVYQCIGVNGKTYSDKFVIK